MKRGQSKGWKAPVSAGGQDECGVWIDATELRAKKQRKAIRPISKLLNPLARAGGYSMAVALNFTQTKMEMPATKQSTISSFFLPRSKEKRHAQDCRSVLPSEMSSPLPEAHTGTKRKREMIFDDRHDLSVCSLIDQQRYDADSARVAGEGEQEKEQHFLHLIWGYQSEQCEPAGKRRAENIMVETQNKSIGAIMRGRETVDQSEEVTESHTDQGQRCTHENFRIRRSICTENNDRISASLSEDDVYTQEHILGKNSSFLTPRPVTEIQNAPKHLRNSYNAPEVFERKHQWSPVKREDKENTRATSQRTTRSPFKQKVSSSPVKHSPDFNWKLCRSPKKVIVEAREKDEDSYSTLFTQDSEGFRVIAHRSKESRCPLMDQTNTHESREHTRIPPVSFPEAEEDSDPEPDMLFTQDSQGNIVIKH